MTVANPEHIMRGEHFAGISNQTWRDTYAFVPSAYCDEGLAILAGSEETAYVQYESARIHWFGEGSDFVRENPGRGRVIGVVNSETVYEKSYNERLPLSGIRMAIARRRATKLVCSLLDIDYKTHVKQPEYSLIKNHL